MSYARPSASARLAALAKVLGLRLRHSSEKNVVIWRLGTTSYSATDFILDEGLVRS